MGKVEDLREYYDSTDMSDSIQRAAPDNRVADEIMISTSIRLPKSLMDQVRSQAEAAGIPTTTLMRQWIVERATADPNTAVVSVVDLRRLIAEHAHPAAA